MENIDEQNRGFRIYFTISDNDDELEKVTAIQPVN